MTRSSDQDIVQNIARRLLQKTLKETMPHHCVNAAASFEKHSIEPLQSIGPVDSYALLRSQIDRVVQFHALDIQLVRVKRSQYERVGRAGDVKRILVAARSFDDSDRVRQGSRRRCQADRRVGVTPLALSADPPVHVGNQSETGAGPELEKPDFR